MYDELARNLRVLRAARGITLEEAEELTGVTRETLGALEHGQRGANTTTLSKIAEGYDVTVSDLLEGTPTLLGKAGARQETGQPEEEEVILELEDARDVEHLFNHLLERSGDLFAQRTDLRDKRIEIDIRKDGSAILRLMPAGEASASTGKWSTLAHLPA